MSGSVQGIDDIKTVFGEDLADAIQRIADLARTEKIKFYLVGGAVRDLLLQKRSDDIDFLIEGDAAAFTRKLASSWSEIFPNLPVPASPVVFPRYGTAKLFFPAEIVPGVKLLDFASTRAETYPTPGQAPVVKPGDLKADLARRDFSINAMAISLREKNKLEIIDQHSGQEDLKAKRLRILHKKSFLDDPARLIRAVRFLARLDFKFMAETKEKFEEGVKKKFLETLPKQRLLDEVRKALEEKDVAKTLLALESHKLLKQIHPEIELTEIGARGVAKEPQWEKRFRLLFPKATQKEFEKILETFGVGKRELPRFRG